MLKGNADLPQAAEARTSSPSMTLTLPTPDAGDTARQRFALELLLQQPVPGLEQLLASRNLLNNALPDVSPNQWRNLQAMPCLLYTSPSPRDGLLSRMPSSA